MGFSNKQMRALQRSVVERDLGVRVRDGKEFSYIEGWYAIAEANRIFGFDGWDRETLETKCILGRETRGSYLAVYAAKVRLTVRTDDRVVVREGHGTGEGRGSQPGEVHDTALKAAETDATKRALATFGKAFGLMLYANGRGKRDAAPGSNHHPSQGGRSLNGASEAPPAEPDRSEEYVPAGSTGMSHDDARRDIGAAPESPAPVDGNGSPQTIANGAHHAVSNGNGIDKSALTFSEPQRLRDKDHLHYVSTQPCLLCSARPSDAHHVRFAQPRALGRKVSDEFAVPLCRKHHRDLHHDGNEAAWWHDMGIDPIEIARQLWNETLVRRA